MRYLHYAHMQQSNVRTGQFVRRGDVIGRVGKGGNATSAHCHFEIRKDLYGGFNFYPYRYGKAFVLEHYENPFEYMARPGVHTPMVWTHTGYTWLSYIGFLSYHPGVDLNWGYGDQDLGRPLYACEDGTIAYNGTDSGWGPHVYLEPVIDARPLITRINEALREAGAIVDAARSDYWQARVARGDKKDFPDLVNGIKYRMVNKLYPHANGR